MHPSPPRGLIQWYKGTKSTGMEEEGYSGLGDLNITKQSKQTTYKLLPSLINVTHSICNGNVRLGLDHSLENQICK